MNWYYVNAGQQLGPVEDAQLDGLVQAGQVQADTLVWHEGMPNWLPYGQVRPAPAGGAAPPVAGPPSGVPGETAPQVVCTECGRIFPIESTIQYGASRVCAGCKPVFMQKLAQGTTPRMPVGSFHYGGFWIRVAAKLLDWLIVGTLVGIPFGIWLVSSGAFKDPNNVSSLRLAMQLGVNFLAIVVQVAYEAFFVAKYAATPGKMACGLKVVTAEGDRVGVGRAIGRAFGQILSRIICGIGYLMVAFDAEKRALHDHMCGTRVIYK